MPLTNKKQSIPKIGGLPASRRGAIILALLCALGAALIIMVAVGQYKQNAQAGSRQETVLVATSVIEKGTAGSVIASQQLYKSTPVVAKNVAPGAIVNASALNGTSASKQIVPGQQLTVSDFAGGQSILTQLGPNQRAVSLTLDSQHGNAGVAEAGDHVDVYGSFNLLENANLQKINGAPAPKASTGGSDAAIPVVRLLAANALVLRAPGSAGQSSSPVSSGSGTDVVLAVSQTQTPDLTFAADNGKVWLALRPADADDPSQAITDAGTVVFGVRVGVQFKNGQLVINGIPGLVPGGQNPTVTDRQWAANNGSSR